MNIGKSLALICSLCMTTQVMAQRADSVSKRFVSIGGIATSYKGSLSNHYQVWRPGVSVAMVFNKRRLINGSFHFTIGSVEGSDPAYSNLATVRNENAPNDYFKTSFGSLHYQARLNFWRINGFTFYASQGLGFMRFNPTDREGNSLPDQLLTRNRGESYGQTAFMLPTGIGCWYHLPNGWAVNFQTGWLNTQTDYLDNVGQMAQGRARDNVAYTQLAVWLPF